MIRLIATPELPARRNLALTEALLHGDDEIFRLQRFRPGALVGAHQALGREVDLPWCAEHGVEVARRMTGGGAIIMDPGILGWELILRRDRFPAGLAAAGASLCRAIAGGLAGLGLPATFRPRNDIVVDGRKLAGTGGYFDRDRLLFQGTVLVDPDFALMTRALRLPERKLSAGGDFAARLTSLRAEGVRLRFDEIGAGLATALAAALGAKLIPSTLHDGEAARAAALHDAEIGTEAFVHGHHLHQHPAAADRHARRASPAGIAEAVLRAQAGRIQAIAIGGDFFITPPRVLRDLEAVLTGRRLDEAEAVARGFLATSGASIAGAGLDLLADVIAEAACASA